MLPAVGRLADSPERTWTFMISVATPQSGSVTDIYLPKWFTHNMPAIHTPLLVLMTYRRPPSMSPSGSQAS